MAYEVAKQLCMRPLSILEEWSVEELMVAYGIYANRIRQEQIGNMSKEDRRKGGFNGIKKWAVLFIQDDEEIVQMNEIKPSKQDLEEQEVISRILQG